MRGTATETTNVLGDQSSLAKYCEENSKVQRCSPEPMPGVESGCLFEVAPEENDREPEEHLNRNISKPRMMQALVARTILWYKALPTHSQNCVRVKNAFFCPSM